MLSPAEATPRALALLTMAHELYAAIDSEEIGPTDYLSDEQVHAVLASDDDDDTVDWQAIAMALSMIGHVLLDLIPSTVYSAAEVSVTHTLARHFKVPPEKVEVSISERLTGTQLLQMLSLKVMEMESDDSA